MNDPQNKTKEIFGKPTKTAFNEAKTKKTVFFNEPIIAQKDIQKNITVRSILKKSVNGNDLIKSIKSSPKYKSRTSMTSKPVTYMISHMTNVKKVSPIYALTELIDNKDIKLKNYRFDKVVNALVDSSKIIVKLNSMINYYKNIRSSRRQIVELNVFPNISTDDIKEYVENVIYNCEILIEYYEKSSYALESAEWLRTNKHLNTILFKKDFYKDFTKPRIRKSRIKKPVTLSGTVK
jgi:hypothetical protein